MSATNKTQNYELSQFVAGDIPGWLSDYNGDMRKIDTAISDIATAQAGGEASVTALAGRVTTVENAQTADAAAITGLQNSVAGVTNDLTALTSTVSSNTTNISGLTTRVGAVETGVSNLNTKMGDTSISTIGDGTVTGAIASIASGNEIYSTSEVDTGKKWIDGKTIYRKVITTASPSTSVLDSTLTASYVDTLVSLTGTVEYTSSAGINKTPIGMYIGSNDYYYAEISGDLGLYGHFALTGSSASNLIVIVEYTKVTTP